MSLRSSICALNIAGSIERVAMRFSGMLDAAKQTWENLGHQRFNTGYARHNEPHMYFHRRPHEGQGCYPRVIIFCVGRRRSRVILQARQSRRFQVCYPHYINHSNESTKAESDYEDDLFIPRQPHACQDRHR